MRAIRTYGSVRGALSNGRPYRDDELQWGWEGDGCLLVYGSRSKHQRVRHLAPPSLEPTLAWCMDRNKQFQWFSERLKGIWGWKRHLSYRNEHDSIINRELLSTTLDQG